MAEKMYSTVGAKKKLVVTKNNKKEFRRILTYLEKGYGAQAPQPKGRIVYPVEYYRTQALENLPQGEKFDAVLVISKDNHFMAEDFPEGVPIYFVTMRSNRENFKSPQNLLGTLRVACVRPRCLIEEASNLLDELLPKRLGVRNVAVYCDFPLLASQLLNTEHRLFVADHKVKLSTIWDYEYALRAFVTTVVESRAQHGRHIGNALWHRPSLKDGAMRAIVKKFGRLLDENDLKIMGFEPQYIEEVIEKR